MSDTTVRTAGLVLVLSYAALVGWLFAQQPASLAEAGGGLSSIVGAYRIDPRAFDDGVEYFRNDQFVEARAAFARADPARRDARTQFYIAYSFYRQGWGRFSSDDELYRQGLEAVDRAIALAPGGRLVVDAPGQQLRTADELRAELEAGLRYDVSDLSPMRVFRPRK